MRIHTAFALALLLTTGAQAADTESSATRIPDSAITQVTGLRERALKDDVAYAITEGLTSEIGARLAGSDNDLKARDWMIARFKALGFDKVWSEEVSYPRWIRRSESAAVIEPFAQPLAVAALGNSAGTPKGGLETEVVRFESLAAMQAACWVTCSGR